MSWKHQIRFLSNKKKVFILSSRAPVWLRSHHFSTEKTFTNTKTQLGKQRLWNCESILMFKFRMIFYLSLSFVSDYFLFVQRNKERVIYLMWHLINTDHYNQGWVCISDRWMFANWLNTATNFASAFLKKCFSLTGQTSSLLQPCWSKHPYIRLLVFRLI